jgi:hypothetical protein
MAQQAPHLEISLWFKSILPQIWVKNAVILVCPLHVHHGTTGQLPMHNLAVLLNIMLGGPFPSPPHSALSTSIPLADPSPYRISTARYVRDAQEVVSVKKHPEAET